MLYNYGVSMRTKLSSIMSSLKRKVIVYIRSAGSIFQIYPERGRLSRFKNQSATQNIAKFWVNSGAHISSAIRKYKHEQK